MMYFAVRHKTTQRLLPQAYQTGSTWWHPDDESTPHTELPRLFKSKKAALAFIVMWAKGHAVKKSSFGQDFEGNDDYDEWLEWEVVPNRARTDLEILPVTLTFGEPL